MNEQKTESYEVDSNLRKNHASYLFAKGFDCGEKLLNKYYRESLKRALKSENVNGIGAINSSGEVIAFCTLTFLILDRARIATHLTGVNHPPQVPAVKLSMLAVDLKHQRQGIGGDLLMVAIEQAVKVHDSIPVEGMYLDAAPTAIAFYAALGFKVLDGDSDSGIVAMFLPINTMIALTKAM